MQSWTTETGSGDKEYNVGQQDYLLLFTLGVMKTSTSKASRDGQKAERTFVEQLRFE